MSYFQLYEMRRNLYKKIQPGSVWKSSKGYCTIVISSVYPTEGKIDGTFDSPNLGGYTFKDTINWLLRNYRLVEK